jgi:hypothetical protein
MSKVSVQIGINYCTIRQVSLNNNLIKGSLIRRKILSALNIGSSREYILSIVIGVRSLEQHRSESVLLDSDFGTVPAASHESTIRVLAEETAVQVFDGEHLIVSDHDSSASGGISFIGTWDGVHVPNMPVLLAHSETLIVHYGPGHLLFAEEGTDTGREEDLRIPVTKVTDNYTIRSE